MVRMNKAIFLMPDTGNDAELITNGVHMITIIEHLDSLKSGLCQQLVKEAAKIVGENPRDQERYLQSMCDEAHRQQGRSGGTGFRDILKGQ